MGNPDTKKVLLHICCGVCALYCIEELQEEGFVVEGLFFNPNIHPYEEYQKRKDAAKIVAEHSGIPIFEDYYAVYDWCARCNAYDSDPEGGQRCLFCYELRLARTFAICREKEFDYFSTTLTVSPHKKSSDIIAIGQRIGREKFLCRDFKKNAGFEKTMRAASRLELYRQNYCGCIYSRHDAGG
jgi:predicted adenine nucleotide alpha hydrolase (AANH) superfamily ATPase